MGLDIYLETPGRKKNQGWGTALHVYSGSYTGFNKFRSAIADEAGINLDSMDGFDGNTPWDPRHPLTPFLNHSDCDGELSASECALVAPELRRIFEKWVAENPAPPTAAGLNAGSGAETRRYYGERGLSLVEGMEKAAVTGGRLVFD